MSGERQRVWVWIDTSNPRDAEALAIWRRLVVVLSDSARASIMREIFVSGLEGVAQKMRATQLAGGTGLDGLAGISLGDLSAAGSHRRAQPSSKRRENAEGEVAAQPELEAPAPAGPTSAHEADQTPGEAAAPTEPPVHEPVQSIVLPGSPPSQAQTQPSAQVHGPDTVIEKAAVESASDAGSAAAPELSNEVVAGAPTVADASAIPTVPPVVLAAEPAPQEEAAPQKPRPKLTMW